MNLTKTEQKILDLLLDRGTVSRADILHEVYGYPEDLAERLQTRTVDVTIGRIRKKLTNGMKIHALYGVGYKLEIG